MYFTIHFCVHCVKVDQWYFCIGKRTRADSGVLRTVFLRRHNNRNGLIFCLNRTSKTRTEKNFSSTSKHFFFLLLTKYTVNHDVGNYLRIYLERDQSFAVFFTRTLCIFNQYCHHNPINTIRAFSTRCLFRRIYNRARSPRYISGQRLRSSRNCV